MEPSMMEKLKLVMKDPLRKNVFSMTGEFIRESFKYKRPVQEYFSRYAYRKGFPSLDHYVMDPDIGILQRSRIFHSEQSQAILEDKLAFFRFCLTHDIPTPRIYTYTKAGVMYDIHDHVMDVNQDNFQATMLDLMRQSPLNSIFIKLTSFYGGFGSYRIDETNINDQEHLKEIYEALFSSDYIIQETLKQHEVVAALNPHAINTLRIDSYTSPGGECRIMSAYIRLGRTGSVVDNQSSTSGFLVKFNLETHRLEGLGMQLIATGNQTFTHHPDTKIALDGYHVVYIDEALALIKRACELIGDRLVGWDICIGPEGPILIEGNHDYHILLQEVANGGFRHHPIFKEVLKEANISYP